MKWSMEKNTADKVISTVGSCFIDQVIRVLVFFSFEFQSEWISLLLSHVSPDLSPIADNLKCEDNALQHSDLTALVHFIARGGSKNFQGRVEIL